MATATKAKPSLKKRATRAVKQAHVAQLKSQQASMDQYLASLQSELENDPDADGYDDEDEGDGPAGL